jgi:hypothetical protein
MKNLNHKQFVQKLRIYLSYSLVSGENSSKLCYSFLEIKNLIGFNQEICEIQSINFRNNFYKYSHYTNEGNKKLYKKYPTGVFKNSYKEWLKIYNNPNEKFKS